ncbi:MAG: RNA 2',3'-cyclic phosphodiesterase [Candidatus Sericytochromatia bacterium]|nr:RNA 2',3'-cyclic phosphodiesterase [Candidatus Tanganyikabacteria bacterium]
MRAFVALCVPEGAKGTAREFQDRWRSAWGRSGVSWTRPEEFHLTLRFLGDAVEPRVAEAIGRRLLEFESRPSLPCRLEGPLGFPSLRRPTILALDVSGPPDLLALADQLDAALHGLGLERRDKPFRPHLTLGRVRDRRLATPEPPSFGAPVPFTVARIALFRSELSPAGSRYEELAAAEFSG